MSICASIHSWNSENQRRVKSLRSYWCEHAPVEGAARGGGSSVLERLFEQHKEASWAFDGAN